MKKNAESPRLKIACTHELMPIDKVIPYHANIKKHPDKQIDRLASMIREYGFDVPIVVDKDGIIIKGHGRLEAAKKLGLEKVPVIAMKAHFLNLTINALNVVLNSMVNNPLRTGPWNLSDLKDVQKNGLKVFSCFHCGGGSSMGYKLAGFEVLGGVEIDAEMMAIYRANHKPKHSFLMGVQKFKTIPDENLPEELFNLDILDGSPPCSSFSMAGVREKKWNKASKFREGQAVQVLDDLFFDFIDIAKKLNPKVVVAENVKGLILGNARGYVKEIFSRFKEAGYDCQFFLLNAAAMGVPQKRERTFFVARRKDLEFKPLKLEFNEPQISCSQAFIGLAIEGRAPTAVQEKYWNLTSPGECMSKHHPKGHWFNRIKLHPDRPANTLTAHAGLFHWKYPRFVNDQECIQLQSFPKDFNFLNQKADYVCGMSVPPFMMQRLADQIYRQFFAEKVL